MLKNSIITMLLMVTLVAITANAGTPGRITVQGNKFHLDGSEIYMNGVNTPWNVWDEFGSLGWRDYSETWWENEFIRLKAKGINSCRVWISCSGTALPFIDADGHVTGVSDQFWADVDHLMSIAAKHKIYVMATMMTFDHTTNRSRPAGDEIYYSRWRAMFQDPAKIQSMINNYIVPFVNRYKDNPYLYAIDLCNEPEYMNYEASSGNIPFNLIQRWVAMCAAAIHKSQSEVLVTVGSACVKWNSDIYEKNYWTDARLQAQYNDPDARLDFYQIHYYLWMESWFPLLRSPAQLQLTDKPLVLGELPARNGSDVLPAGVTMASLFEYLINNNYSGHYPWMSNGNPDLGSLNDFGDDALAFKNAHSDVVRTGSDASGYAVTYNANGASSGVAPANQTKTENVALYLAGNSGNLAKSGYTFDGWNTAADGSGTDYAAGASYTANAALSLFAKWAAVPTYAVTYNANGASSGSSPASQTKTENVALTLAGNSGNLAKSGHTFDGWNTAANGSGTDYAAGASYTTNAALSLFAKWAAIPTYIVAYHGNGADGGVVPTSQTKTHAVTLTLSGNSGALVRSGHTFQGWNTAANASGTDYPAGSDYTTNASATLYAQWSLLATPTITVTPIQGDTTEGGGSVTFTIVLDEEPAEDVLIPISSSDVSEGVVSGDAFFTPSDWDIPKTITVVGVDDDLDDGNINYTIILGQAVSDDSRFNGLNPADLNLVNEDDDDSAILVGSASGNTTEAGGTATFTVALTCEPTADVTISVASQDASEGTSSSVLTFTSSNWGIGQTATVTGVDDAIVDGNVAYTVSVTASGADAEYAALSASYVSITNMDNDSNTAALTLGAVSGNTTEAGGTATFSIALTSQPSGDVVISLASNNTAEGTVSPSSLTFTTSNWSTARTVVVTGVDDQIVDGDITYNVVITSGGQDSQYASLAASAVSVTNEDDDSATTTETPAAASGGSGGGGCTVSLNGGVSHSLILAFLVCLLCAAHGRISSKKTTQRQ